MLLHIAQLPKVKLCKILTADKIICKSAIVETLPFYPYDDVNPKPLISETLLEALWKMVRTCLANDGIGLAAPQIGIFKQIFIIRESAETFRAYINPHYEISSVSQQETQIEGCLSIPGRWLPISRATIINAQWLEFDNDKKMVIKTETLTGLRARIFQHELDHCRGFSIFNRHEQQKKLSARP